VLDRKGPDGDAGALGAAAGAADRRTVGAGFAAARAVSARACSAATDAFAATALILLSRTTEPTAATSAMRRTRISEEIMLPAIPPGVYVCSFGTRRTARGSPRLGSSTSGRIWGTSSGVHHFGGATAVSVEVCCRTAIGSVAAIARRR
jgi:hypothetical protein